MTSQGFGTYVADAAAAGAEPAEERGLIGEELFWGLAQRSAGVTVNERTSLHLTAILATVNVLATDVAVLPLRVYRRREDGGRDLQADHQVDRLLNVSPDGETTPLNFKQALMGHAALWGVGLAEIVRSGRGAPTGLYLLDPDCTQAKREGERGPLRYRLPNGRSIPHENVLRVAGIGHDGLFGWNIIRLVREAIGLGLAAQGFAGDYFQNGSEAGGVIQAPNKLGSEGRKNLVEGWELRHQGAGGRHKVAVLEQGATYNQTSANPDNAQLVETRKFQVMDATRPWRVPPHKIGDYSQSHLANIEASNLDYLTTALMPWLVALEQEGTLKLLTPAERAAGYYLEHNVNALLRGDIKSRFESYGRALADGWMSRDEVRQRENMNPIGAGVGGGKYLVQLNQTTLDRIGEETEPGHEPADPAVDQVEDQNDPADAGEATSDPAS